MLIRLTFIESFNVKACLAQQLAEAVAVLKSNGFLLSHEASPVIRVVRSRHAGQGDFSSNLAMLLAKSTGRKPQEIGQALISAMPQCDAVRTVTIAGPGFINFYLTRDIQTAIVSHVLEQGRQFGRSEQGAGRRVRVEVVFFNAAGPLHIGHGREAVLGDTVANLLQSLGFEIERNIRVTDASGQVDMGAENREDLGKLGIQFDHDGFGTSLASDISRIANQLVSGLEKVVSVCGADCQGYAASLRTAAAALGLSTGALEFLLVQPVAWHRDNQKIPLSARKGDVPLAELYDETGKDAARFFYLLRSHRQRLDFNLELAAASSSENPLYSVQYAHARIGSVERQFRQQELDFHQAAGLRALTGFAGSAESEILRLLAAYPEIIECAALAREPHQLTGYLRDLANALHTYYNAHKILVEDVELRSARYCLLLAVRQVLVNGLTLIDVSTPEVM